MKKILLFLSLILVTIFTVCVAFNLESQAEEANIEELQNLFNTYYNDGVYVKDTVINVNEDVKNEVSLFHAKVNDVKRTTYYNCDELWFSNGSGYGTSGNNLTTFNVTDGIKGEEVVSSLPKMEDYYCTLYDFVNGSHQSAHSNNVLLNLENGWTVSNGVYSSSDSGVLDAFRLFTAPLWLGKTEENKNYIDYTKATVEVVDNSLVMKLWISANDAKGKLVEGAEYDGNNSVFSQATVQPLSIWDGSSVSEGLSGSGTSTDPYLIQSASDLALVAKQVTAGTEVYSNKILQLTKSINLNYNNLMIGKYTKNGDYTSAFSGTFDGQNYRILNMKIKSTSNGVGLFAMIGTNSLVKNLIVDGTVTGADRVGGIIGQCNGSVENCINYATISNTGSYIGGIVGTSGNSNISNCVNYGSVNAGKNYAAGIVGCVLSSSETTVTNCVNNGMITNEKYNGTSSIVGGGPGSTAIINVINCINNGTVTGNGKVGGFVGYYRTQGTIENCINYGILKSKTTEAGAIVGFYDSKPVIVNSVNRGQLFINNELIHTYGEAIVVEEATNEKDGILRYTCTSCGDSYDEVIPKLHNHTYSKEWTYDSDYHWHAATCEHINEISDKIPHNWVIGEYNGTPIKATCECGATKTKEVDIWDGSSASSLSGTGSATDPYLINSAADLAYFANSVTSGTNYSGKYIKLTISIDLNNKHLMIGNANNGFAGTFDGCNNFVLNMKIVNTAAGGTGLFAYVTGGTIKNVTTTGKVSGAQYTGSVAGLVKVGSVINCKNYADVVTTTGNSIGGVVGGTSDTVTFDGLINYGSVTANKGASFTGGIVGISSATISNCSNHGTVISSGERTGGIVGEASGNISNCVNNGNVNGGKYIGGITGTSKAITISDSRNNGSVVSTDNYAGGISGCVTTGVTTTIKNCSNFGDVNAISYAGCIAGGCGADSSGLRISDCENDSPRISVIGNAIGDIVVENMSNVPFVEDEEIITVLMLSNSYGDDTRAWVHEIADSYGVKINVANLYIPGCILDTHLSNLKNNAAAYQLRYYENGTWNNQAATKISDALGYRDWDYVMLQQGSSQSGLADKYGSIDEIMDIILTIKNDVKFFWNMTWAYQQDSGHSKFSAYNNDQMTMYNGILNAVQTKVLTNDRIEFVIPNGTAVQNARTSNIGDTLCRDTSCHLTYEFGRYIAALTFFNKVTGIDISDVTFTTNITEEEKAIAIESVKNALANPYQITKSKFAPEADDTLDLTKYMKINWEPTVNAYWYATSSYDLKTTGNLALTYIASKRFTKQELPVGTIIEIKEAYQYRPDGWAVENEKYTGTRPGNVTTQYVEVTEDWWKDFNYRGFNIALVGGGNIADVASEAINAFNIYIPLEKSGYTKLDWQPTIDSYWESTKSVDLLTGNSTATKFVSSKIKFTKEELPVGSIIVIESGYRYRPDGWTSETEKYTGTRPGNVTTQFVEVTEEWWGEFTYRAFNVSLSTGAVIGDKAQDVIAAFNIYVPNK